MLKHVEMDAGLPLQKQVLDTVDEPVILINLFNVDSKDTEAFKAAWGRDAAFFKAQPGYISAQLHQGFGATMRQPEFGPSRGIYPDSATAHPHLFRRVAIPGICIGEV